VNIVLAGKNGGTEMHQNPAFLVLFLSALGFGAVSITAQDVSPRALAPIDEENHARLIKGLSSEQIKALSGTYPDFRILRLCSRHLSGADRNELVLGIWNPVESKDRWKREVHRVGLIWNANAWEVHVIDDEIERDEDLSQSFPMKWQYTFTDSGFSGEWKCGIDSEFTENSDLTYGLGDKPFFDLKKEGLMDNTPICFATDDVYNNWDCVVYSPRDGRFRLWFQQAHAD
jgi:hypothetical protein